MNLKAAFQNNDRGVSPVIGVILMVAITVILAAVIGTFVLGLGDQLGDSAPQATFSSDNATVDPATDGNISFEITKTGGEDLDPSDITLVVDGSRTIEGLDDVDDPWRSGTTERFEDLGNNNYDDGDNVDIRLVHDPSGNSIYETTITVREA